jgi:antitoxin VapB
MPFHVRDAETDTLVRKLARAKGLGLTEAVKLAVRNELQRAAEETPLRERLRKIAAQLADYPRTGKRADKEFFDELSGA